MATSLPAVVRPTVLAPHHGEPLIGACEREAETCGKGVRKGHHSENHHKGFNQHAKACKVNTNPRAISVHSLDSEKRIQQAELFV